jgi:hypothetical protein
LAVCKPLILLGWLHKVFKEHGLTPIGFVASSRWKKAYFYCSELRELTGPVGAMVLVNVYRDFVGFAQVVGVDSGGTGFAYGQGDKARV